MVINLVNFFIVSNSPAGLVIYHLLSINNAVRVLEEKIANFASRSNIYELTSLLKPFVIERLLNESHLLRIYSYE